MAHLCKGGCHDEIVTGGLIYLLINYIFSNYIQPMFSIPTGSTFVDPPPLRHKGEACSDFLLSKET